MSPSMGSPLPFLVSSKDQPSPSLSSLLSQPPPTSFLLPLEPLCKPRPMKRSIQTYRRPPSPVKRSRKSFLLSPKEIEENKALAPALGALSEFYNAEILRMESSNFIPSLHAVLRSQLYDLSSGLHHSVARIDVPEPSTTLHYLPLQGMVAVDASLPSTFLQQTPLEFSNNSVEDWKEYLKDDSI